MGWFAWLDAGSSNAFAREISEEFAHNFPADAGGRADKATEQRLTHAIEVLGNRAAKYDLQARMGWYRKARFMAVVKDTLAEQGYAQELVDRVVYAVVLRMARRKK